MKDFTANFVSMFIADKKRRHTVRRKIKHWGELILPADAQKMIADAVTKNLELARKEYNSEKLHDDAVNDLAQLQKQYDLAKQYIEVKKQWRRRCNGPAPLPGRFAEYDLVFGIGAACSIGRMLRFHNLRLFANPFDWTGSAEPEFWWSKPDVWRDTRFREKVDFLCNDFKGYFNPADLKPVSVYIVNKYDLYVVNVRSYIRFGHVFNVNQSLEKQMPNAVEKMERRANRLLSAINKSDHIMICWLHRAFEQRCVLDAPVSDKDIKEAVRKLQKKWPDKTFDLVFFEHDGTKGEYEFDKLEIVPGAYRVRSNHFIKEDAYYHVASYDENSYPDQVMAEMLDNVSLTDKLADFMKAEQE